MADKEIKTLITATTDGFEAGMKRVDAASKAAFKSLENSLSALNSPFAVVERHLGAITALLAGGAAFRGAIDATKEWGGEQASLAKQLQITTAQAAGYQVVSRELGLSGDLLVTASDKLTKQMVNNGQAFDKLGISTKTSSGALRATGDVLPEVIDHLRGIHNVTEQNAQGIALFGKGWTEVRGILKASSDALQAATERAKELNLVVDSDQLKKYKTAMADVKLITTSMEVQIGSALLPTLTKLGLWLGGEGPEMSNVFKTAIDGVSKALISCYYALEISGRMMAGWAAAAGNLVSFAADVAVGNLAVAASDLARNLKKNKPILADMKAEVEALADRWGAALKAFDNPIKPPKTLESDDTPHVDLTNDKDKKDTSRMPQWDAELAELKLHKQEEALAEGKFYEMSKADEKAFWDQKKALTVSGTTESAAVRKKDAELGLAIMKDSFDTQLDGLKTQADAYKNNMAAKLSLAGQEAVLIGQKYGLESKEYAQVQGEIVKLEREAVAQAVQLEEAKQDSLRQIRLGEIDVAQETANEQYSLGLITNQQLLELERGFEDQRYQIQLTAQQARLAAMQADPDHSPIALQKEKDQLLQIEQQHALAVQKISASIRLDETANVRDYVSSLEQNFSNVFAQLLQGHTTFAQASKNLMNGLVSASAQAAEKMLADQIAKWVTGSAVYKTLMGTQAGTDAAAAAASITAKKGEAAEVIPASTGEAAMAAASAVAGIPVVGPELAAFAYADMMALGGAALISATAAGGYDIPSGLNPVVQTHAREMILPAKYADMIRGATNNGGGGGDIHNHFTIHAMDGASVKRMLMNSGEAIVASINAQARNFNKLAR